MRVEPTATLREVVARLREASGSCVVIVEDERLAGFLTVRDLLERAFFPAVSPDAPVAGIMNVNPQTLRVHDTLADALNLLDRQRFRFIPVVDDDGRPQGVVSVRSIMQFLAEALPEVVLNLPPEPTVALPSAEGA